MQRPKANSKPPAISRTATFVGSKLPSMPMMKRGQSYMTPEPFKEMTGGL